jgi:hypothetical protein
MENTRQSWIKLLREADAYIRLRQKLHVSPLILRKLITLIPVRIDRETSSHPNIPLCLSQEQKQGFRARIGNINLPYPKARTLVNSIYRRSVAVFGELSNPLGNPLHAININNDDDDDDDDDGN